MKEQNYESGEPQLKSWFQCIAVLVYLGVFFSLKWYPASLVPIPLMKSWQRKIFRVGGDANPACFQNQTGHQSRFEKGSQRNMGRSKWSLKICPDFFHWKMSSIARGTLVKTTLTSVFVPWFCLSQLFLPCFWCCPEERSNTQI